MDLNTFYRKGALLMSNGVIITIVICITIVAITWISRNEKK